MWKTSPSQKGCIVPPASSGSSKGPPPCEMCPGNLCTKVFKRKCCKTNYAVLNPSVFQMYFVQICSVVEVPSSVMGLGDLPEV